MDLAADARLAFDRPTVFAAYRDHLTDLLPYLPNVRGIQVKSRSEDGTTTKLVNEWSGGGEIPAAARAFISEAMLSWTDHAQWDAESFVCKWRIETHAFTEAVTCRGENLFLEDGQGTLLQIRGVLEIDASKIQGVPRLLAGKVGRMVAEVLAGKIRPNLVEVSVGLGRYLEGQAKGAEASPRITLKGATAGAHSTGSARGASSWSRPARRTSSCACRSKARRGSSCPALPCIPPRRASRRRGA